MKNYSLAFLFVLPLLFFTSCDLLFQNYNSEQIEDSFETKTGSSYFTFKEDGYSYSVSPSAKSGYILEKC